MYDAIATMISKKWRSIKRSLNGLSTKTIHNLSRTNHYAYEKIPIQGVILMFLFWDNSNIHYSGLNNVFPLIEGEKKRELYRTYFRNLFELVRNDRQIVNAFVAGSVPPPSDSLWEYLRNLNIELTLLDKTIDGKEQESVDISLQSMMLRTILDNEPSIMAVLTGDGAGNLLGKGFLADLRRAKKRGWDIEVYAWEVNCNQYLKEFAEKEGKFIPLERHYYSITFLKGERVVQPLVI